MVTTYSSSPTVEALVEDIQTDIRVAKRSLERAVYLEEAKSPFFT
jgi:hypothetical protein